MGRLVRHYLVAAVVPFSVALFTGLALNVYKTEWSIDGRGLDVYVVLIYSLFITILSLGIFVNIIPVIANNQWNSLLAWMLLPSCFMFYVLSNEFETWKIHSEFLHDKALETEYLKNQRVMRLHLVGVLFLHLFLLIATYIRFRKKIFATSKAAVS